MKIIFEHEELIQVLSEYAARKGIQVKGKKVELKGRVGQKDKAGQLTAVMSISEIEQVLSEEPHGEIFN